VAVNLHEWRNTENSERWQKSLPHVTPEEAIRAYHLGIESMAHLNKNTAKLMKKYECHGATDITGFGLLGHAQNLVNV
jgi:selenide,water dikinase